MRALEIYRRYNIQAHIPGEVPSWQTHKPYSRPEAASRSKKLFKPTKINLFWSVPEESIEDNVTSVSYTHLDVYKRQAPDLGIVLIY